MKRYADYKDSGVAWIGEIPNDWDISPLFVYANENETQNTGLICENLLSLSYGEIIRKNIDTIFGLLPESFETYQIIEQGFTIMRLTDLQNDKRSLRTGYAREKGIITSAYLGLMPKQTINSEYFSYLLHAYDLAKVYYSLGGGVRQTLKFSDMKRLPIVIPPIEQQEKIVGFIVSKIASIDFLVANKQKLIELLKEKRQAIISEAVTKGLDPTAPMKDSGNEWIGQIPAHWDIKRLKHTVALRNTKSNNSSLKYVGLENVESFSSRLLFNDVLEKEEDKLSDLFLCGDVLFGKLRPYLSKAFIAEFDGQCSGEFLVFKPIDYEANYLLSLLLSWGFINYVDSSTYGTKMPRANWDFIGNMAVPIPPQDEQNRIANYTRQQSDTINSLIADIETQIEKLKEYRQTIISEAVTGKIMIAEEKTAIEQPNDKQKTVFKRLVLSAYILDNICDEPTAGRVKFVKLLHLSEHCAQIDLQSNYKRHAAGPLDSKALYSIEQQLQKNKWFGKNSNKARSNAYIRLEQSEGYKKYIDTNLDAKQKEIIDKLLRLLKGATTERCEIVATLYGAWNDFLIDGIQPSDEQIVTEVLINWHESKEKIDRQRWFKALSWMREHGIIPIGYGISTKGGQN